MSEHTTNINNVNTDDSTDTDDEEKMPARINISHNNIPNDTSDTGNNNDEGNMTIIRQEKNTYIIYEPTFRKEWMDKAYNGEVDYQEAHKVLLKKDWLTEDLCRKIIIHCPKQTEI